MESSMVGCFDNRYFLSSEKAIVLIENLIGEHMSVFKETEKFNHGAYFGLVFSHNDLEFKLGGGRGFLEYSLRKDQNDIKLIEYDVRLNEIEASSDKNIRFVIDVVKKYLQENNLL